MAAATGSHSIDPARRPDTGRMALLVVGGVLAFAIALAAAGLLRAAAGIDRQSRSHLGPPPQSGSLPEALAPAVSASVGASERTFWPARAGDGFKARGGGIQSSFAGSGAALQVSGGTVGFSLTGVGRGRNLQALATTTPVSSANEVSYRYGPLTAFYRNGPYGLEQGFTLQRPRGSGAGSLVLSLSLAGSLTPEQVGSQILFRSRAGGIALRYSQLHAVDATGRQLPVRLRLAGPTLQLVIDDAHARYPLRVDPFVQQGEALMGSGAVGEGDVGASVALSSDGSTALVAAPGDNGHHGAAWVFTRSGSTWTQQGEKLTGGGLGTGRFGSSVALSGDGNTALIGAPDEYMEDPAEPFHYSNGLAWTFTRSGSSWTRERLPLASEYEDQYEFGVHVALSADGSTALVSPGLGSDVGAEAQVFTRSGDTWSYQDQLPLLGGGIVRGLALSADGNVALVGATGYDFFDEPGAAWLFTRHGTTWTPRGEKFKEVGGGAGGGRVDFGSSVALSSGGSTALVGDPGEGGEDGAAWVFTHSSSGWAQEGKGLSGLGDGASFGTAVALSSDGDVALIGEGGEPSGAAWLFKLTGSVWTQQGAALANGAPALGSSVALSSDGETALIGGVPYSMSGDAPGGAWAFDFLAAPAAPTAVTGAAAAITPTSATLDATVDPNGAPVTDCRFRYSAIERRAEELPCSPNPGSGEGPVAVSAAVSDLKPNTTYRFRISARNAEGRDVGSYVVFTTATSQAPTATMGAASSITAASATLKATVDPNGGRVRNCRFEYGPTEAYGSIVPCSPPPGSSEGPVVVSAHLRGLSEYTTYHFKVLARNRTGSGEGEEASFTTSTGGSLIQEGSKIASAVGFAGETLFSEGGGSFAAANRIALSADGNTMVVGAPHDAWGGSARVYVRSGSTWVLQARLAGFDERAHDPLTGAAAFGSSVAISGDGNTVIVGAPRNWDDEGEIFIYTRSAGIWTFQPAGFGPRNPCTVFCYKGTAVALSAGGDEAAYAGFAIPSHEGAGISLGTRSGAEWTGEQFFGGRTFDEIHSLALSADGNTILMGVLEGVSHLGGNFTLSKVGLVVALTRSGAGWQQEIITGAGEIGEGEFGSSVALSSDGKTALIGASRDNGGVGASWVLTHTASGWTQQGGKLTANNEIGDGEFGSSVALSGDGNHALIGGRADNANLGAAWTFTRTHELWTQQPSKLTASDETGEGRFASSLALSSAGTDAVIGAPGDDGGVGAFWSFGLEPERPRHHR